MASIRSAIAAAARASSRRDSGLVCPRGGAGREAALLLWSHGGAPSMPCAGVRGFSTGPKGKAPLWSWETIRAKADELHDAVFSTHGLLYIFCTTSAGFAIYYVDGAIAEERRSREGFERSAVKGHQDHVERTIANIEKLKEKMGSFWDRFLSYREDDLQYRDVVTKAADMLKRKGYIVLPASELEKMKSQIAELTVSMAEMNEFKEKFASLVHEEQTSDPLKDSNEEDGIETVQKENLSGEPGKVQPLSKKQFDSEKGKGDGCISDGVQSAVSDMSALKKASNTGSRW